MSRRVVLLLEPESLLVFGAPGVPAVPVSLAHPAQGAARLREVLPRGVHGVLVIGVGLLEVAEPTLPPVPPALRLPLLRRESDRFLPLASGAAVAADGALALGMDGGLLDGWVAALEPVVPLRGVVTLPQCAAWAGLDGTWHCPAAPGEVGEITVRQGALVAVRRKRARRTSAAPAHPALPLASAAEVVGHGGPPPLEDQLLTPALHDRLARRRRRAWWRSGALVACGAAVLAAGYDRHQTRALARLAAREQALVAALDPARAARARLERARQELAALGSLAETAEATTAPLPLLAALSELLPADAVVDRLAWDGVSWRLDGSARDAAALVPRLASDPRLRAVRSAAPSQQFTEGGEVRRSFAITLETAEARPDGASARPEAQP
jgi:hypothetical protein